MVEVCRVHNRKDYGINVAVEPWGNQYEVPKHSYLSIWIDEEVALIEIVMETERAVNVYLNECTFDDITTKIISYDVEIMLVEAIRP
jgi:uncharacterized protein (UPF0262 family)